MNQRELSSASGSKSGSDAVGQLNPGHLFPCAVERAFTTAPKSLALPKCVVHIPLSDDRLGITKVTRGASRDVVDDLPHAPNGTHGWRAVYPEGSINPGGNTPKGGFGCYIGGPGEELAFSNSDNVMLSYAVYFEPGFDFNRGGKLPGLYGGSTAEIAYGCSGGRKDDRDQCFSIRLMWRKDGAGEIYAYLPLCDENTDVLSKVPPKSKLNADFGFSVGMGAWCFTPGEWAVIAQRVKLNDVGQANGELDLWVNGVEVISARNIIVRCDADCVVRGSHFQTFFGGHTPEWASPKTQCALFADISGGLL